MLAGKVTLKLHFELHRDHYRRIVAGSREKWGNGQESALYEVLVESDTNIDKSVEASPSFQVALSCNMSIRKDSFLELGKFDERLRAYEDLDLAYRAEKANWELILSSEAIGYHNHPMSFLDYCNHSMKYQYWAALFLNKHPELRGQIEHLKDKEPISWADDPPVLIAKKIARMLLATPPVLQFLMAVSRLVERMNLANGLARSIYWKVIGGFQYRGFRKGIKEYGW
jgi:GT2 family glycosyltransferase